MTLILIETSLVFPEILFPRLFSLIDLSDRKTLLQ